MANPTSFDFDTLRSKLYPPVTRASLIQVVSMASNIPPAFKGMAFVALSGMKQKELDNIGGLIGQALDYIASNDLEGLEQFFKDCKIPPQFTELFKLYASNIVKE